MRSTRATCRAGVPRRCNRTNSCSRSISTLRLLTPLPFPREASVACRRDTRVDRFGRTGADRFGRTHPDRVRRTPEDLLRRATTNPGNVVLTDNLGAHEVAGVRQAVEAVGACVVYLPIYSPDFNPIELWWADLKRQLRRFAPRAIEDLARKVRQLRAATTLAKLVAWFRRCLFFLHLN
ncbi:transposase [Corallococcus exercitus]|uniref:transposase n=1 Tax=Corallococcus exercitus TaxID=2316736 RepID=UPI0026479AC3|nr:transposase [Corallococcus exercitus]